MTRFAVTLSAALATTNLAAAAATSAAPPIASAPSLDALGDKIGALLIKLGDGQSPARGRACKTNSEGVCVYRGQARRERPIPPQTVRR